MNTIFTLAKLTFREAVRRKIMLAALILGVAFLLLFDLGMYFIGQEITQEMSEGGPPSEMMRGQAYNVLSMAGMYVVNFLVVAIAALITADSLAGEIQSGTIQAVVTKPIRRMEVVLGKWFGHAGLMLLYVLMMGGGVLLSMRLLVNYATPNALAGLALIYFNSLIIMTLTLACSSRLSTMATGGAVFGAFGLAFIGGWVERIGTLVQNQTAMNLGIASSLLLPSEALWNKAAGLMSSPLMNMTGASPFTSASDPSPLMLGYAALYLLAGLFITIRMFSNRDL